MSPERDVHDPNQRAKDTLERLKALLKDTSRSESDEISEFLTLEAEVIELMNEIEFQSNEMSKAPFKYKKLEDHIKDCELRNLMVQQIFVLQTDYEVYISMVNRIPIAKRIELLKQLKSKFQTYLNMYLSF